MLKNYTIDVAPPDCNPMATTVNAMVQLEDDISEILPYLNAVVRGASYDSRIPCTRFAAKGHTVIIRPTSIGISSLKDEAEAHVVLEWLIDLILSTYRDRDSIEPSYRRKGEVKAIDVFGLLPRTNCKKCGEPTCLAFAVKVAAMDRKPTECPPITEPGHECGLSRLEQLVL